jgi:hypothetical protein
MQKNLYTWPTRYKTVYKYTISAGIKMKLSELVCVTSNIIMLQFYQLEAYLSILDLCLTILLKSLLKLKQCTNWHAMQLRQARANSLFDVRIWASLIHS